MAGDENMPITRRCVLYQEIHDAFSLGKKTTTTTQQPKMCERSMRGNGQCAMTKVIYMTISFEYLYYKTIEVDHKKQA